MHISIPQSGHKVKKLALLFLSAVALACGAGLGAMPMSGGVHGQGGSHPGFVDHRGFVHHGFDHRFDGHHRHFHGHGSVFIGVPFWWEPPIYYAPPIYVAPTPSVYIEQGSDYWYYCTDPAGYYPYIQSCPQGWLQVVPSSTPQ